MKRSLLNGMFLLAVFVGPLNICFGQVQNGAIPVGYGSSDGIVTRSQFETAFQSGSNVSLGDQIFDWLTNNTYTTNQTYTTSISADEASFNGNANITLLKNGLFSSPYSAQYLTILGILENSRGVNVPSQNNNGWTRPAVMDQNGAIYVSSSTGNDNNSGLSPSQPLKSLQKAMNLLNTSSINMLLLKKGDTWGGSYTADDGFGCIRKGGPSAADPLVFSSYYNNDNQYARPVIIADTNPSPCGFTRDAQNQYQGEFDHIWFVGLDFDDAKRDPNNPNGWDLSQIWPGSYGIYLNLTNAVYAHDWLFEDNVFRNFVQDFVIMGQISDVKLRRNIFTGAYAVGGISLGFYANATNNVLLEQNIFDHNGWLEGDIYAGQVSDGTLTNPNGSLVPAGAFTQGIQLTGLEQQGVTTTWNPSNQLLTAIKGPNQGFFDYYTPYNPSNPVNGRKYDDTIYLQSYYTYSGKKGTFYLMPTGVEQGTLVDFVNSTTFSIQRPLVDTNADNYYVNKFVCFDSTGPNQNLIQPGVSSTQPPQCLRISSYVMGIGKTPGTITTVSKVPAQFVAGSQFYISPEGLYQITGTGYDSNSDKGVVLSPSPSQTPVAGLSSTVGVGPTILNRNIYFSTFNNNVTLRQNIITRSSSEGAQVRPGGLVDDNFFARNGNYGFFVEFSPSVATNNVVSESTDTGSANVRGNCILSNGVTYAWIAGNICTPPVSSGGAAFVVNSPANLEDGNPFLGPNIAYFNNNISYNYPNGTSIYQNASSNPLLNYVQFSNMKIMNPANSMNQIASFDETNDVGANVVFNYDNYYTANQRSAFNINNKNLGISAWQDNPVWDGDPQDVGSIENQPMNFIDPMRNAESYNVSLGGADTFDDFMSHVLSQSRNSCASGGGCWDSHYTADAVNNYIRQGFAS